MIASAPDIKELKIPASSVRNKDVITAVEFVSSNAGDGPITTLFDLLNNSNQTSNVSAQNVNDSKIQYSAPQEWTAKLEQKFVKLARIKALGRLSLEQLADFERMSAFRRAAEHPRSGEEIVAEYQQRILTQELVTALTKYIEFHRHHSPHSQRKTS
jgi:hypothetical protein